MAHALGAVTFAEGAQLEKEATALVGLDLGVDRLQGYLTGRPMPAAQLCTWLAERNPQP